MATFTLKVDCDNEAFKPNPRFELLRILARVSTAVSDATWYSIDEKQTLRDENGNTVGYFMMEE